MQTIFETTQDWLNFDRDHLWHPYTSMNKPLPCYPVVAAQGAYLKLADGSSLIDGMSSWWSAIHGYNHPKLNAAVSEQIGKMSHVMFGGIAHQPAAELGARLVSITPAPLKHVFFADSGSIAIEVALKMALQYWQSTGRSQKTKFLTVRGGYHGDPFSCMSVGDPENGQHGLFPHAIAEQIFVSRPKSSFDGPWDPSDIDEFEAAISKNNNGVAAVILEPIVQGAGGMHFYHPEFLKQVRELCDHYEVLLILDEIATGFGRTGKMFACEHAEVIPDILCIGKALTGGMMTLAATLATSKVAMGISQGKVPALMHGPTFMANPLACAVSCASIDVLLDTGLDCQYSDGWQKNIERISFQLNKLLAAKDHQSVEDVRILGAIGVVEMAAAVDVAKIQALFVERGVWIRPFGKLVYVMPPYIITDAQLKELCGSIVEVIGEL